VSVVLAESLRVVNVGLEGFAQDLAAAGVPVTHVDWRPPDPRVAALLARLESAAASAPAGDQRK
jgi:hypothetical protein